MTLKKPTLSDPPTSLGTSDADRITRQVVKSEVADQLRETIAARRERLPVYVETYQMTSLLRFHGIDWYYQAGRDPHVQEATGFVLLSHTMRVAIEDGVREYRLLEGDEAYKYRFATEDLGLQTVGFARGLAGRLAFLAGAASLRSNRTAKLARRTLAI